MSGFDPIVRINRVLDRAAVPHEVNEALIEALLADLNHWDIPRDMPFWLTTARITELTLLCAGHYADNCEFLAAGDLLLNPRKIRVDIAVRRRAFIKTRHGRLTDQLSALSAVSDGCPVSAREADCQITTPALLPFLHGQLGATGVFGADYMDDVAARMLRIADTLTFLAAYQTFSNEALLRKLRSAGAAQRDFVTRHLCRFSRGHFDRLGRQIDAMMRRPEPGAGGRKNLCAAHGA